MQTIAAGDEYYKRGMFDLALIEYDRAMRQSPGEETAEKKALSEIRRRDYRGAMQTMDPYRNTFGTALIHMYAALRLGLTSTVIDDHYRVSGIANLTPDQYGASDLLLGTLHLENRDYDSAIGHYNEILKNNEDRDVRRKAASVLTAIDNRADAGYKSPWIGGIMSAILPGSGQIYASHEADGIVAFLFNATLLGSAATLYNHEHARNLNHNGSAILGGIGLFFYSANVAGGAASAKRYNSYQDRIFHEKVRDDFFNIEFIEEGAKVKFEFKFN